MCVRMYVWQQMAHGREKRINRRVSHETVMYKSVSACSITMDYVSLSLSFSLFPSGSAVRVGARTLIYDL